MARLTRSGTTMRRSTPHKRYSDPTCASPLGERGSGSMDGVISGIGLIESIGPIASVLKDVMIAWRNSIIFRHRSPYINITHDITHRVISPRYTHIAVTATLHNRSHVKVEFFNCLFVAQNLAPLSDEDVEGLYSEAFNDLSLSDEVFGTFPWETLEEFRYSWDKDELIVEPGETRALTIEFVVDNHIEAVLVTTYLYNERVVGRLSETSDWYNPPKRNKRFLRRQEVEGPIVWIRTSPYDIT